MRRVTVRVSEDGDWQFRAERADGRLIFELQSVDDDAAAPTDPTVLATEPPPVPHWHAGEFGNMVGSPNEDWVQSLYTLRDIVELALPNPRGARVVEIGAGSGETTVAYARDWRGIQDVGLWLMDPGSELSQLLTDNIARHVPFANILREESAVAAAQRLSKQDLSLLIISSSITRAAQSEMVKAWIRHLVPGGKIVLRAPADGEHVSISGYAIDRSGEWLLYSPAEPEGEDG